jgi:hypothetical protein
MLLTRFVPAAILGVVLACFIATPVGAAILYDESVSGDLSNSQSAPTARTMAAGTNSIKGFVDGTDSQDWVALTVPAGNAFISLVLASYVSTDPQGFTGFQAGPSFVGSPFSPSSYLGYAHFGTGATNGSLPPMNLVGADLFPYMGNTSIAPGAVGFTPPLSAGTYTFLIQQLGSPTAYQFDFNVAPCPPGDFNFDGRVNAADYVFWRKNSGLPSGYDMWRAHFGQTAGSGSGSLGGSSSQAAVPEPASALLLILGIAVVDWRGRRIESRISSTH